MVWIGVVGSGGLSLFAPAQVAKEAKRRIGYVNGPCGSWDWEIPALLAAQWAGIVRLRETKGTHGYLQVRCNPVAGCSIFSLHPKWRARRVSLRRIGTQDGMAVGELRAMKQQHGANCAG